MKEQGALWDDHKKQWFITEHHDTKDFKWWLPFYVEDSSEEYEEEEQNEALESPLILK